MQDSAAAASSCLAQASSSAKTTSKISIAGAKGVVIREYRNGRDITQTPRGVYVIDLFGLSEEEVRDRYPAIYEWVYNRVKPERDQNRRASTARRWWIHGEPRANFRACA